IPLFIGKESNSLIKDNSFKIMPSIAIMNQSGELLYQSPVSDDKYILDSFLDFKTNTDLLVSLGRNEFNEFLNKNETLNSLIKNKLRLSTEKEAMLFMIEFPSSAYGIVDFAEFLMSVKNDFLSSEHYLKFLKEKEFLVSEKFLKILVSSFMLHDDFDRLSDFINFLIVKFKNDPMAASSLYSALAEINLAQSLTIEAINFAEKSYSLDPKRVDNLTLLGMLNFNINKGQSEKYFRSALIHDPENIIANSYLYKITNEEKYSTAAKQAYYSGRDDFFGLRFFSNSIHFNNVGILELRDRAYRIKIELFPEKSEFKNDLAKFIADNKGDMAEALEITKALLAQEPNNQDFLSTASWVFYNLGDFSSADKLITKALGNISPDEYYRNQFIFYYLGMIKSAIGDNRSASYYFEKLISYKEKEDIDFNKFNYAKKFIESIH
ncbi:MAG: hypothetical protein KKD38_10930, partial [Candidatus Delongbacteria bacterium]|nr:hypothetical protein [Candidatus Delongbacteria bacterium]